MRRQPTLEKAVVHRIMAVLRTVPGLVVRKRHGTAMGLAGDPDLYGTFNGVHFELEVKRPNDPSSHLTRLQTQRIEDWKRGGAIVGVVRTVAEATELLGLNPKQVPVWICRGCRVYRWPSMEAPARCPRCGSTRFDLEAIA